MRLVLALLRNEVRIFILTFPLLSLTLIIASIALIKGLKRKMPQTHFFQCCSQPPALALVRTEGLWVVFNKQVFVIKVDDVPSSIAENDEVSPKRFSCFFQNDLLSEVV